MTGHASNQAADAVRAQRPELDKFRLQRQGDTDGRCGAASPKVNNRLSRLRLFFTIAGSVCVCPYQGCCQSSRTSARKERSLTASSRPRSRLGSWLRYAATVTLVTGAAAFGLTGTAGASAKPAYHPWADYMGSTIAAHEGGATSSGGRGGLAGETSKRSAPTITGGRFRVHAKPAPRGSFWESRRLRGLRRLVPQGSRQLDFLPKKSS